MTKKNLSGLRSGLRLWRSLRVGRDDNNKLVGMTIREVLEVVPILLAGEAGAGFVDAFEFTVTHDLGIRIVDLQGAEERN